MNHVEHIALPVNIFRSRKRILRNIGISGLGLMFSFGLLLSAVNCFTGGTIYPKALIVGIIGTPTMLILMLKDLLLLKNIPVVVLSQQGLVINNKQCSALGTISWSNIISFKEIAFSSVYDLHGRKLWFAINDLTMLTMTDARQREETLKLFRENNGWLFSLTISELDYDQDVLKELIAYLIVQSKETTLI